MQQLLNAIERIRGERNALRTENTALHRDFDFLQAESRFAIQSLRDQLHGKSVTTTTTAAQHSTSSAQQWTPVSRAQLEKAAVVAAIVAQHSETERELSVSRLETLSAAFERTQSRAEEAERMARERQEAIQRIRAQDREMQDCLATTEFKLSTSKFASNCFLTCASSAWREPC